MKNKVLDPRWPFPLSPFPPPYNHKYLLLFYFDGNKMMVQQSQIPLQRIPKIWIYEQLLQIWTAMKIWTQLWTQYFSGVKEPCPMINPAKCVCKLTRFETPSNICILNNLWRLKVKVRWRFWQRYVCFGTFRSTSKSLTFIISFFLLLLFYTFIEKRVHKEVMKYRQTNRG